MVGHQAPREEDEPVPLLDPMNYPSELGGFRLVREHRLAAGRAAVHVVGPTFDEHPRLSRHRSDLAPIPILRVVFGR